MELAQRITCKTGTSNFSQSSICGVSVSNCAREKLVVFINKLIFTPSSSVNHSHNLSLTPGSRNEETKTGTGCKFFSIKALHKASITLVFPDK